MKKETKWILVWCAIALTSLALLLNSSIRNDDSLDWLLYLLAGTSSGAAATHKYFKKEIRGINGTKPRH